MDRTGLAAACATCVFLLHASTGFAQTPYSGTPSPVPGTIQAEDFDRGGEGVGYHDSTPGNSGGQYRMPTNVDIESATDGAYDVGWITAGEWLRYTVDVAASADYLLEARVASKGQGGTFHIEFGGVDATGPLAIPNTGGWQNWTTLSKTVSLTAGTQGMRVAFDTSVGNAVGNVTWYRLTRLPTTSAPHGGAPWAVPGVVHAENFDDGGEGVAYHDSTAGNRGGQYRSGDVDIETCSEGGYDIGWIADGEWLAYTVNAAAAGQYTLELRVASLYSTGSVRASFNGSSTTSVTVPSTGGWQTYTTITVSATLAAGTQVMKIMFDRGAFNLSTISIHGSVSTSGSNLIRVPAGADLQAAINNAQSGDTLLLEAGATFTGNFVLPAKNNAAMITIRSSAADSALPGASTRIDPSYAPLLPKLKSPNRQPALATAPGAHHYTLMGLEFPSTDQGYYIIVQLGDGSAAQNTLAMVPHDLVLDRVYVHGDVTYGQKVGITLNTASTTVTNSYVSEIKAAGQDSQAIAGTNGPGPFTITNNYLEAAGENVLFGGADPAIPNLIPSDITFRGNHVTKQAVWRSQTQWNVKNLFELKNAQRVVIDGNVMEYNWLAGQSGYAIQLTTRNQDGTAPWSIVQQVQFTNNIVRHVASGINILGTDNLHPSGLANHITIRNNLFEDLSGANWGGNGRFLMVSDGAADVVVDHNTALQDGWCALYGYGAPMPGFVFTNNIVPDYSWAIMGASASPGNPTIAIYFPTGVFVDGIYAGSNPAAYPVGNYYPTSMTAVGFVDLAGGNYRLSTTSPYYRAGSDGTDVGCNIDALNAAARIQY